MPVAKVETKIETDEEREEELFEKRCKHFRALPHGVYMVNPKTIIAEVESWLDGEDIIYELPDKLKKILDKNKRTLYCLKALESDTAVILNRLPPRLGNLTDAKVIYYETHKINVPYKCTLVFALDH